MGTKMRRSIAALVAMAMCAVMAPAVASADTLDVRARDNGDRAVLPGNDQIRIILGSCEASCGYSWKTTKAPNSRILRRTSTRIRGQVREFVYTARERGRTSLQLSYDPPGSDRATRHFRLDVTVTRPACRPGAGDTTILSVKESDLYEDGTGSVFGCVRSTGRNFEIFDRQTGQNIDNAARFPALKSKFAGYVEYLSTAPNQQPAYTVNVWDITTGERSYSVPVTTTADAEPFDTVSAFTMTRHGDSAWIVARANTNEVWVRDGAGAVRKVDEGTGVDRTFLASAGNTVTWRKDGQDKSETIWFEPSISPEPEPETLTLGLRDGQGSGVGFGIGVDTRLVVRLPACEASCGYRWRTITAPNPRILERTSTRLVEINGRDYREFTYMGIRRGDTKLRLDHFPPGSRRAEDSFRIDLRVG